MYRSAARTPDPTCTLRGIRALVIENQARFTVTHVETNYPHRAFQAPSIKFRGHADRSTRFGIQVTGPHYEDQDDHTQKLLDQLNDIPKESSLIRISEDTPSDTEWSILGNHFTSVKDLEMDTGFNEQLNDKKMPLHWPLERLSIGSACSEVFRSPFILEGKIRHLILLLTSGLRFEGPSTRELVAANKEAIWRGEAEENSMIVNEGTPEERNISIVWVPELASKWLQQKYAGQDEVSRPPVPFPSPINLEKLEILENDAIDTFTRMFIALPHLVDNIKDLNLRSTVSGLDFHFTSEEMFQQLLPQMSNLKTLTLTVGDVFEDEDYLPTLYKYFPPNLSTLRFRGPVSLVWSEQWEEWVASFSSREFLPCLEKLSFTLDLDHQMREDSDWKTFKAQDEDLREAKVACKTLYAEVENRGVSIEPFHEEWSEASTLFTPVDARWNQL